MIHIAILAKQYIRLIESGAKTVECRLTKQARPPFDAVEHGDRIYFKQSAGPYRLTAVVDHVLFEGALTPQRIKALKRDYNDFIHGSSEYWQERLAARYGTLIWFRDVEPIKTGPAIPPQRGLAWITIADPKARLTGAQADDHQPPGLSFSIEITGGNIRNNSLYVSQVIDQFPRWCIGGRTRRDAARPIVLLLRNGPRVETDIVGPRKLFRKRIWGDWYQAVGAKPGDRVVFTPVDESTYFVGLNSSADHTR